MSNTNGKEFFRRKLHSLLGVIPIGIFLTQHLIVNHFAVNGASSFNKAAAFMADLPFRYVLEIFIIFLPILYHAIYGLYIAFTGTSNVKRFGYFRNWMYILQRISGVITLIFIVWHLWETRIAAALGSDVNYMMMHDLFTSKFILGFYIVGIISTTFHFANGLWSFLVSWGITVTPRAQRISTYVTLAIFVALTFVGLTAIFAFVNPHLANM